MRTVWVALLLAGCVEPRVLEVEPVPAPDAVEVPAPVADPIEVEYPPAPAFQFKTLGDSTQVALEDYAGRFLLVDFWATWCSPCLEEIPRIADVLEDHPDRLAVLSVSLDLYENDVEDFRGRFHPMPWDHAFAGDRFEDEGVASFGVDRLPVAFLIGPDGTIRAQGGELRRDLLRITIERALEAEP